MRVFLTSSSGLDGFALFAVRLVVSVVLAELSFRFIERPFRVGRVARRSGSRGAIAYFAVLTVVAAVLVATVAAPKAAAADRSRQDPARSAGNADPNALRVDTFGDSTALVFGLAGAVHAEELGISVGGDAQLGCGVVQTDHVSDGPGHREPGRCAPAGGRAGRTSMRDDPNARLALMTGAWEILDQDDGRGIVRFGTPAWTDLITSSLRTALGVLTARRPDRVSLRGPVLRRRRRHRPVPGTQRPAPHRRAQPDLRERRALDAAACRSCTGARSCARAATAPRSIDGVRLWQPDEQHLTDGGAVVVWKWWLPQLRAATGSASARAGGALSDAVLQAPTR